MAYNYTPQTPIYPQPFGYPQVVQPVAPPQMIWVKGEAEARNYQVAQNTTLPLWDNEEQKIYLKSVDASGMPTMKVLRYTIDEQPTEQSRSEFITKADFDDFANKVWEKFDQVGKSFSNKSNSYYKNDKRKEES